MTVREFSDKLNRVIEDAPQLREATLKEIEIVAQHNTQGIIIAWLYAKKNDDNYKITIAYNT